MGKKYLILKAPSFSFMSVYLIVVSELFQFWRGRSHYAFFLPLQKLVNSPRNVAV